MPLEIRNRIYEYAVGGLTVKLDLSRRRLSKPEPALTSSGALRVYYSLATIHLSRSFWVFSQKYGINGLDPIAPHAGLVKKFELHVCGHRNHHELDLTKEIQLGKITMIITQHG